MKSIAFFNNKGGVGKTTLLCNVAAYFSSEYNKRVLIIDADPQCNSTQYILDDHQVDFFYEQRRGFTLYDIMDPLYQGSGYSEDARFYRAQNFGVGLLAGDPRISLMEDLLSEDWGAASAGRPRGIKTSLVFKDLLSKCTDYDLVFFDVGPSLGSINRSILLSTDYFLSPLSTDIFSIRASENIATWMKSWQRQWSNGVDTAISGGYKFDKTSSEVKFAGYVTQQYVQKSVRGTKRPVKAYDQILQTVDKKIREQFGKFTPIAERKDYDLGSIPNLYSLIPMSQRAHVPIFKLKSEHGVVGAHFSKVAESKELFHSICNRILENIDD
ncbi:AAA family ATPase [Ruegeria sp.]|uniref:ParA family protein n=1 Tax=Ruegeria sp. TaxID=1879320 RepID=UPI0023101115|nr:AAA family ATPase [Ruegeria sp.]MDA7965472.1 AAA family ATPase [Ruegeria sp.]